MAFTFFHAYMPKVFEAQINAGLFRENDGIRFCQSIDIDENLKFNNLAKAGGKLYNFVKDNNCPLYIDRLQGGCFFEGYDYDMELVRTYSEMLGKKFFGFQMHEWMSNFISDTDKLVGGKCPEPWTEENITATLKRDFPFPHIFTEAMSVKEFAEVGHITELNKYLGVMEVLFLKRQKYTGEMLLPCDSAILGYSLEFKNGAKRVMPEIGQQTKHTSVQIAYARGMSKAYGKSFGTYYEPWGGEPFSACNYQKDGLNEWNISNDSFPFKTAGGNGGSSRSLQKRMYLYSYVSGAEFISEEWGLCNTFCDWNDFELTPYGQVKKDFINFTEKYKNIGKPITPVAAVIPKEIISLDNIDADGIYCSFNVDGELKRKLDIMRTGLRKLFAFGETFGNENGSLVNRLIPDAVDIVNEDVYDENKYTYAVNLTGDENFEKKYRCCSAEDVPDVLNRFLPCKVTGGLHHIVNKNSDDEYFLTIFNNTGIVRSVADGEYGLKEAEKTVQVELKDGRKLLALYGNFNMEENDSKYYITVPAGELFFGRF